MFHRKRVPFKMYLNPDVEHFSLKYLMMINGKGTDVHEFWRQRLDLFPVDHHICPFCNKLIWIDEHDEYVIIVTNCYMISKFICAKISRGVSRSFQTSTSWKIRFNSKMVLITFIIYREKRVMNSSYYYFFYSLPFYSDW